MAKAGQSLSLYFDYHGSHRLAQDVRSAGYDVLTAAECGNSGLADDEHLRWAADRRRCLFTHDLDDFPILAIEWAESQRDHAGIVVSLQPPRLPHGEMLCRLLRLLATMTADGT